MVEKLVKSAKEEVKSLKELLEKKEIQEEKPETVDVEIIKFRKNRQGTIYLIGKMNIDGAEYDVAINTRNIDIEKVKVKKIGNKYYLTILKRAAERAIQNPFYAFNQQYLVIFLRETDLPPE